MVSPPNMTSYFQSFDLTVNRCYKAFLRNKAQTRSRLAYMVDLRISTLKPLHTKVMVDLRISTLKALHTK